MADVWTVLGWLAYVAVMFGIGWGVGWLQTRRRNTNKR